MKALRPVAGRLKLRSTAARPSKPLRKHNATAQAAEGNLGGFCVYKSRIEIIRGFSRPTLRFGLSVADGLGQHLAEFGLRLRRFPLGWLPVGHGRYVGTRREN
jgi:hypothetical protein